MPTQSEVDDAEQLLLSVSNAQDTWSPKELRKKASQNLSFEIISLAFWRLLNRGELVLDYENGQIHRAEQGAN